MPRIKRSNTGRFEGILFQRTLSHGGQRHAAAARAFRSRPFPTGVSRHSMRAMTDPGIGVPSRFLLTLRCDEGPAGSENLTCAGS